MANELTWRQAIEKILAESATPLHYNEITERIIADGLGKSFAVASAYGRLSFLRCYRRFPCGSACSTSVPCGAGRMAGMRILVMLIGAACGYLLAALFAPAIASSADERVYRDFAPAIWAVVGLVVALLIDDFRRRR
jgi:hypothetical protein